MIKLLTEDSLSNEFFVVHEGKIIINPIFQEEFGDRLDTVESRIQAMLGLATEVSHLRERVERDDLAMTIQELRSTITSLEYRIEELERR